MTETTIMDKSVTADRIYKAMAMYPKNIGVVEHNAMLLVLPILCENSYGQGRYSEGESEEQYLRRMTDYFATIVKREAYSGLTGSLLWLVARYAVLKVIRWWVENYFKKFSQFRPGSYPPSPASE